MFDRKRSHSLMTLEKRVATGFSVDQEGSILVSVEENGEQVVRQSNGDANETVIGFSMIDNYTPSSRVVVEEGSIPDAPGPYTVELSHTNIVTGQLRVWDHTVGAPLVPIAIDYTLGILTFNLAVADHEIVVHYRYNLTVDESVALYGQRHSNAGASAFLGQVSVMTGAGEIWTDRFDVAYNYSNLAPGALRSGLNGIFTTVGAGTPFGVVIHAPTPELPWLGVAFSIVNRVGM